MKKINLKGLDEVIYQDECDNGLKIYVWVKPNANHFNGTYVVNAGSEDVKFTVDGKNFEVPFGTAHYLEHYLCSEDDHSPYLKKFNELGSSSNAATYPNYTIFEFFGSNHFEENMNCLLDWTYQKAFDEQEFEKERGPILEECRMYLDHLGRESHSEIQKSLFSVYPSRENGIGTEEDILKISMKDVESFYQTFYHPKNSYVFVSGKVDPVEVIHMIKENQKEKTYPKWIEPKKAKYKEPKKVCRPYFERNFGIEVPRVYISVKVPLKNFSLEEPLVLNIMNLIASANFGSTSTFREELLDSKLAITLGAWVHTERDYLILELSMRTKYPEEVIPIVKEKLNSLEFLEDDIKRKLKVLIANMVLGFENIDEMKDSLIYMISHYGRIIEEGKELLESVDLETIRSVYNEFSPKENCVVVFKPFAKKKDEH